MNKLISILLCALFTLPAQARIDEGGWDSGGGGSGYAAEFTSMGRWLASNIDSVKGLPFTAGQFLQAVDQVKVEFVDERLGSERAQVLPEQRLIRVSRDVWETTTNRVQIHKPKFVLHLYLLIMGVDDYKHQWTQFVFDGGRSISAFECSSGFFSSETLNIRWVDVDGDGRGDKFSGTLFISSLLVSAEHELNITETDQGVVFNWIQLTGGVYTLAPRNYLMNRLSFKAPISKIDSYTQDGIPIVKQSGTMSCTPL
ncbi:hypothetical protein ACLVWU_12940 [Bdellovibrio sp. HCB290]|uniref:hypothetical protein n=1 Tax=Bdellovibrio sp. HCB290 TaxID=3394356 RepID=UPI0039B5664A